MREDEPEPRPGEDGEDAPPQDAVAFWGKIVMAVAPFILLALLVAGFMLID